MQRRYCDICGTVREAEDLAIHKRDVSREIEPYFDDGSIMEYVYFCCDVPACRYGAATFRRVTPKPSTMSIPKPGGH